MKKFISLMTLLCLCVVNASATVFTELGQELTWEDVKDGNTAFALVSGDKVLYVPTGHDTRFEVVSAISDASNAAYFKVETLDNGYLFHAYNLAGESFELNYSWYKGPGYLNCQPEIGKITFTLAGANDKHGQDFENGAVWTVTAVEGGYTIQNVGNNGYLAGTVTSQEATHIWKFYTYKKSEIANKEMEADDYYIRHAATGKFLGGANSWGTHASLVNHGQIFTVVALDNGKYKLDSHTYNSANEHFLGQDNYVDKLGYEFEFIEAENGVKIVSGTNFVNAADGLVNTSVVVLPKDADVWQFLTHDELIAELATGTEEEPVDATFAIKAANFSRNLYNQASDPNPWIVENCGNKKLSGGNNDNNCAESFHSTFNIYQTLTGLPNGVYSVKAQGFYRKDSNGDNVNVPVFYAKGANEKLETQPFPLKTGTENSMSDASASFTNGDYTIAPFFVQVTDGQLTVGVLNESETGLWCIWDNFELSYYGADANYERLKFAALYAKVEELLAEAKALNQEVTYVKLDATAKEQLGYWSDAANKPALETEEDYNAYISQLQVVISAVKSSVKAYSDAKIKAETFTQYAAALEVTLESVANFNEAYNAGTLNFEVNPVDAISAEYNAAIEAIQRNAVDMTDVIENSDFETNDLTGWTAEGLHTATNKNFGMLTGEIFVENWTPGPGKLTDANSLEQTITLPAGEYVLTAEAQFLQQGDASVVPSGFYLFAGENKTGISNQPATIGVSFSLIEETTITIGAKVENATGNWASIDHFQLFKLRTLSVASAEFSANGASISFSENICFADDAESLPAEVLTTTGEKVCDAVIEYGSDEDLTLVTVTFDNTLADGVYLLSLPGKVIISDDDNSHIYKGGQLKFTVGDIATGVEGIAANGMKNGKFVKNNRIVIVRNGKAYNTAGVRLQK